MKFQPTTIAGAYIVDAEPFSDARGIFARFYCSREAYNEGIALKPLQVNFSSNFHAGTVRGLHYQLPPFEEMKFVRCIRGSVLDVFVDLRPTSTTYGEVFTSELSAQNHRGLVVPTHCAHGYQALTDGAEVLYVTTNFYARESERGLRPDDPALGINWPLPITEISEKDAAWPDFSPQPPSLAHP